MPQENTDQEISRPAWFYNEGEGESTSTQSQNRMARDLQDWQYYALSAHAFGFTVENIVCELYKRGCEFTDDEIEIF